MPANDQNPYEPVPNVESSHLSPALSSGPATAGDWLAFAFAMTFPTFVTLVYFQFLKDSDSSLQQTAYGVGKTLQFLFPIGMVALYYRSKLQGHANRKTTKAQLITGIAFGTMVFAVMFAAYFGFLKDTTTGEQLGKMVREKVSGLGIDTWWKYLGLGLFYSLCHSFLEEYYWRWFTFDYLKKACSTWTANIVSSLGFMAHHVVLVGFFFGWASPLTYLCSLGVAIGGVFWAWQYEKTKSLVAPWLSHLIVDAGIFSLGYVFVKQLF